MVDMDSLAIEEVERIPAPSAEEFHRVHLPRRVPLIFTGPLTGWVPPDEWTFDRMADKYGSASVISALLVGGTLFDDPKRGVVFERVQIRDFVATSRKQAAATHYIMAPTGNLPPQFASDYRVPPYCEGARHLRAKLWLGKAGTVTPVHRDVPHNVNVHLTGSKRWLLFPPGHSAQMYSHSPFSGMPNFSKVDPERPDFIRFPRFREIRGLGATVRGGETLFIPHGWWHHTRTLEDAVAMNFWWGGRWIALASLASTIFKRMRGIRRDEWA